MKRFCVFVLVIFALRLSAQPLVEIGYYSVNGIQAMDSKPGLAVLGNGHMVSLANPTSPVLIGNLGMVGFCSAVTVEGNRAYFGTGMYTKLSIVDITNPTIPIQIGAKVISSGGSGIFGIAKRGNILYVAAGSYGIYTLDISNESSPVVLDSIPASSTGQARDVVVHNNMAYVADMDGLRVVDVSNPSNINIIAAIGSGYFAIDIDTVKGQVYLGKSGGGVDVYTVWNPWSPVPAFGMPGTSGTWDVKYNNDHAFVSADNGSMSVYKIFGGAATLVGTYPNTGNGQSFAVCVQDSLALVSGLINGVAVVKCQASIWTVGLDENELPEAELYPNPFSSTSTLKISRTEVKNAELRIIDLSGRLVKTISGINCNEISIDREDLPTGVYFFQLSDGKESVKGKFVVQ